MGSEVTPAPGWYADPADPKRSISSIGAAITWIVVGVVALAFIILLFA
jgi:hypothetical protein